MNLLSRVLKGLLLGFLLMSFCEDIRAQEVKAEVTVILERLPVEKQEKLADLEQKIRDYINNYTWVEDRYGGEINITIQMYLEDISVSYEDRYKGHFLISDNVDIQYFDKRWRFPYQPADFLTHDENSFHPLTSLIDYYIYLILGGEFDKYGRFQGTPFYEKALKICELAQFGRGHFHEGWDLREDLVKNLLSKENKAFREMVNIYYLGLYYLDEDINMARKYCRRAVRMIGEALREEPQNERYRQFLNAHYIELIDIFKDSPDKSIFEELIAIDPDHEQAYREHLKK